MERVVPGRVVGERDALVQQLEFQRATLLTKLEGLDDDALRRAGTASGVSLLGLVKHLAATEHGWFLKIYGGVDEPELWAGEADFRVEDGETAEVLVEQYLRVCERARAVVAAGELDDVVTTPSGAEANLRAILIHIVQETARHNGHADIIRESIDGTTGE